MPDPRRFVERQPTTDSGRTRVWLVIDTRGRFPNWKFSRKSEQHNCEDAIEAARLLNTGVPSPEF